MTTAASLLLHLHLLPSPPTLFHKLQTHSQLSSISLQTHSLKRRFSISAASSPPPPSDWEREEIRWLREEQRWIREEQRWVREQTRWHSERESLLQEIASLKSQIQELQQQSAMEGSSVTETTEKVASLLQVLKEVDRKQIPESGSGPVPMVLKSEKEEVKEMVVEDVKKVRKIEAIRKGAEGEEVLAMQEALLKLGFYSGEEDMEYSSFSSGTERAIKTWQASLGIPEDGIMTKELLKKLYMEQERADGISNSTDEKENVNGASITSIAEVSEVKEVVIKESGDNEYGASYHQVFLLGENRWEDSSRLAGRDKQTDGSTIGISTTKCLACRGEGHVLCTVPTTASSAGKDIPCTAPAPSLWRLLWWRIISENKSLRWHQFGSSSRGCRSESKSSKTVIKRALKIKGGMELRQSL